MVDALGILLSGSFGLIVGPAEFVSHNCIGTACAFVVRAQVDIGPISKGKYYVFSYAGSEEVIDPIVERLPITYLYVEEVIPDNASPLGFVEVGRPLEDTDEEISATLYSTKDEALADAKALSDRTRIPWVEVR